MSIISRHEDLLLMSCNLNVTERPEEKVDESEDQINATDSNIQGASDVNKSYTESEASDVEAENGVGPDFWLKKRTNLLIKEDSKRTTRHLRHDLRELF